MRQIIGILIIAGALYYANLPQRTICETREDFVAHSLVMVFEHKLANEQGNPITEEQIRQLTQSDSRLRKLDSHYASEEDFQKGCEALDEIIASFGN